MWKRPTTRCSGGSWPNPLNMSALLKGFVLGALMGLVLSFSKDLRGRYVLSGFLVAVLVTLALRPQLARPLLVAVFSGLAMILLVGWIRWVLGTRRRQS